MKTLMQFTCVALVSFLSISLAQDKAASPGNLTGKNAEIMELERITFEAYKSKQADTFKKYLAPNYRGIYADGIQDANTEAAGMATFDIQSFTLRDPEVTYPAPEMAVVTYKADMSCASEGKDLSGIYNCGSVWIKQGGKWLTIIHSELKRQ